MAVLPEGYSISPERVPHQAYHRANDAAFVELRAAIGTVSEAEQSVSRELPPEVRATYREEDKILLLTAASIGLAALAGYGIKRYLSSN
jgi:hypothetical protein